MLGKLLKHEIKSYRFSLGITFLSMLVITILMKIMCMLPYHEDFQGFIQILSFYGFYYAIMAGVFATQMLVLIRFYTTTVGDRGYLTWTLPAKSSTVLWSKLLGGMIWHMIATIAMIVCMVLFVIGDYWVDDMLGFSEMFYVLPDLFAGIGEVFRIKYIIPIVLFLVCSLIWSMLGFMLLYMCIAIGQLFGKWRILASVGAYFVVVFILYLVMITLCFVLIFSGAVVITEFDESALFGFINGALLVITVLGGLSFAGVFAITNNIFRKHLNLE